MHHGNSFTCCGWTGQGRARLTKLVKKSTSVLDHLEGVGRLQLLYLCIVIGKSLHKFTFLFTRVVFKFRFYGLDKGVKT